jgi:hypothetical protein
MTRINPASDAVFSEAVSHRMGTMKKDYYSPHPLRAFLVLAFLLGWGAWALAWAAGFHPGAGLTSWTPYLPGIFGPALAAWLADRHALSGVLRIHRHSALLYLLAWLLPLVLAALVVLVVYALNLSLPDYALGRGYVLLAGSRAPSWLRFWHVLIAAVLAGPLLTPLALAQELGWRAVLQARLFAWHNCLSGAVTGGLWALWLSPLMLMGGAGPAEVALLVSACVLLSLLAGGLYRFTDSLCAPSLALASVVSPGALLLVVLFGGGPNIHLIYGLGLLLLGILCLLLQDR